MSHCVVQLVLLPRTEQRPCIARPEWGRPTAFGSAARVEAITRALPPREADASFDAQASAHAAAATPSKRGRGEPSIDAPGAKRPETATPRRGIKRASADPADELLPTKLPDVRDKMFA